ncbi:MAG: hypothetical protein OXD49_17005 [Candidatus Poribacteria bacterium]|nr:hypothetical protein [Candidatus Poribacteria bacterium]
MHNGNSQGILKLRFGGKTIDPTRVTRFAGCARREKHPAFIPFEGALMKIRWRRWYVFDKIDLCASDRQSAGETPVVGSIQAYCNVYASTKSTRRLKRYCEFATFTQEEFNETVIYLFLLSVLPFLG